MDYLESLGKQISEITMYDVRSAYANAKAMVLNLSEAERLVSEATNNEAWGASSTLMQQIAQGQQFNEIMPAIYKRFTDLDARQWRQVYKALTLLEYLIKNGSERVVDDARQHLSLIKILRNFHYIDEKGKDQGINVRNRSKEVAELLQDLDKVRQERRKAKSNRTKYSGTGSEGGRYSGFGSEGSRYSGFGSESAGGGSAGYEPYGGGSSSLRDTSRSDDFDEYDAGDDEDKPTRRTSPPIRSSTLPDKEIPPTPQKKEPEVNLFDLDDDEQGPAAVSAPVPAVPSASFGGDDDFDDFQGATPAAQPVKPSGFGGSTLTSPTSTASSAKPNFFDMVSSAPSSATSFTSNASSAKVPFASPPILPTSAPRMGMTSPPISAFATPSAPQPRYGAQAASSVPAMQPSMMGAKAAPPSAVAAKPAGGGFDDLWDLAGGSAAAGSRAKPVASAQAPQSMASMAQQKLWTSTSSASPMGFSAGTQSTQQGIKSNGNSDFDLLM